MSYDYDSRTTFSKAVVEIDDVATMLLDQLAGERRRGEEKTRPIILVFHGLGGLLVKKVN